LSARLLQLAREDECFQLLVIHWHLYLLNVFGQFQQVIVGELGAAHLGGGSQDPQRVGQRSRPAPLPFVTVLVRQDIALLVEFDLVSKEKDGFAFLVFSLKRPGRALTWTLIDMESITFQGGEIADRLCQGLSEVSLFFPAQPSPRQGQAERDREKCRCAHGES